MSFKQQQQQRFMELNAGFQKRDVTLLRVTAPETDSTELLSDRSIGMEAPPLRVVPPGHENSVSFDAVEDDTTGTIRACEEEYAEERDSNMTAANLSDDVTLVDPNESVIDLTNKVINLPNFINKCLTKSVKLTKSVERNTKLMGLDSLRQMRCVATASSNMESDEEDEDLDVPEDD